MRLFVACEIGADVARAAAALIGELQARVARLAPKARLTWVPPQRLHVTIRFIGAVEPARLPAVVAALAPPLRHAPFDAVVAGAGTFPERRPPRVIWAGVRSGGREMAAVAREVNARLVPLVGDDRQELRAHLTLARVKAPHGLRAAAVLAGLETVPLGVMPVQAVTLFESRPSRDGVHYEPLARTPLLG